MAALPARALRVVKLNPDQTQEPVTINRINAVTGCITGYDDHDNPIYDSHCITPEEHKCTPAANNPGVINISDSSHCPRGIFNATPTYFLDNGYSARERIFWLVEFDGGPPTLTTGQVLSIVFTL